MNQGRDAAGVARSRARHIQDKYRTDFGENFMAIRFSSIDLVNAISLSAICVYFTYSSKTLTLHIIISLIFSLFLIKTDSASARDKQNHLTMILIKWGRKLYMKYFKFIYF